MKHYCKSCKDGEVITCADLYATGYYYNPYGAKERFDGWLCDDHYEMMIQGGADLTIKIKLQYK